MANNDTAGDIYEQRIARRFNSFGHLNEKGEFSPLFPIVSSTKNVNQELDHVYKVDISTLEPANLKKFGLVIQAKDRSSNPPYPKLLHTLKQAAKKFKAIPVVYHRQTSKGPASIVKKGEFAILSVADFESIWTKLAAYKAAHNELVESMNKDTASNIKNEAKIELFKLFDKYNI